MIEFTMLPTALYGFSQAAMAAATVSLFAASVTGMLLESSGRVPPGHYEWMREGEGARTVQ